jgi:hypothetical protein
MMVVHHRKHRPSRAHYGDSFTFLYVDDVCTSQETYAPTVSYGESFTFLYVDDVYTSQETYAPTVSYWDSFTFYM